jgi:hypothetical protein
MTKTTIPAEIVRVVRAAVLTELGGAAAEIEEASIGYEKEEHPETFTESFARFDALRGLLDAIGWSNETPRTIDIDEHREPLVMALKERLEGDLSYVEDPLSDPVVREAVERDVSGVEDFLSANDLGGGA